MGTTDPVLVVADAGPLIHLDELGALGLLLRAARTGVRTPAEVLRLLEDIPQRSTLHLRPSLLVDVLRQVRETWALR